MRGCSASGGLCLLRCGQSISPCTVKSNFLAALGRKEEALSECRRAVELLPVEKDAFNGPLMIQWYATAAAWVGETDLALEQLATAVRAPGVVSYGHLKLLPFWDPLRGDARFENIVNSLAPKESEANAQRPTPNIQ